MKDPRITEIVEKLAAHAITLGAEADDKRGIVRDLVLSHGLGFCAWLCVCCEIADIEARAQGYADQCDLILSQIQARRERQAAL